MSTTKPMRVQSMATARSNIRSARRLHTFLKHLDALRNSVLSRLLSLCVGDPAAVFLAMRVTQLFERTAHTTGFHRPGELGWHFDGSNRLIAHDDDVNGVARYLANLRTNVFEDG